MMHLSSSASALMIAAPDAPLLATTLTKAVAEHPIYSCTTGSAVLARCRFYPVGCVVLDHHLSDMHGLALTMLLTARWPYLPIVLLTTSGCQQFRTAAIRAGCWKVVPKPIILSTLVDTIQLLLLGRRVCIAPDDAEYTWPPHS